MGLFDSITSLFDPTAGATGGGGLLQSTLGDLGLSSSGPQYSLPVSYVPTYDYGGMSPPPQPAAMPVMSSVPMIAPQVGGALARGMAAFPALAAFLASKGITWTRGVKFLLGQLRKFGPATLVGVIGLDAVNDLMKYSAKHKGRRMNPANAKALRRSVRRLQSFDRLACRVSAQLATVARRGGGHRRASRCHKCKRSPCRC
jgi:hypothetical protein